jgi:hypothetical protein
MKPQGSGKAASTAGFSVTPPSNFSYIEENICRCTFPLTRANVSFVQSINVTNVINLSSKKLETSFQSFCDEKGIDVVRLVRCVAVFAFFNLPSCCSQNNILQEGEIPPFNPVSSLETWITSTIITTLAKSLTGVVLVVGRYFVPCIYSI